MAGAPADPLWCGHSCQTAQLTYPGSEVPGNYNWTGTVVADSDANESIRTYYPSAPARMTIAPAWD